LVVTLVDSNVLLDLFTADPVWSEWSMGQLDAVVARGPLLINEMIYAELSVRFDAIEVLETALDGSHVTVQAFPREALFLAGKTFRRYRTAGGPRTVLLPDFLIGAHALVLGVPLLTRDRGRFRHWFPGLKLITP
jgi:predicted nucleic acid-binding protein